ncbi:MAG: energy-converting hydrogenase Eha subunit C [Halobacteriales archaeon]|jgi:energy-converting hydrogenase Eha subunit C
MATESEESRSITSKVRRYIGTSLASWIILAGAILVVLPEPITSFVGVALLLIGLVMWIGEKAL